MPNAKFHCTPKLCISVMQVSNILEVLECIDCFMYGNNVVRIFQVRHVCLLAWKIPI